jgi:hypothetical protein
MAVLACQALLHVAHDGRRQPRLAASRLLYPPCGATFEKVLALLKRLAG